MKSTAAITSCAIIVLLSAAPVYPASEVYPVSGAFPASDPLRAYRTDIPPVIDGILDDEVWRNAPSVSEFRTFIPDFGREMPERTVVYFAYDDNNLYFAFKAYDSEPDKIKASISARDKIRPDDWICVNLDSFNDQQSLYAIYSNPLGIQEDSRYSGGQEDFSFDMVYYTKGIIDDEGYTIEMQIPLKSIRFKHEEVVEMAVLFERHISRHSTQGMFPPP
ncbi:carbohydrate binding family 9 domain-containing protein [candidate division KSB1 bacterium]